MTIPPLRLQLLLGLVFLLFTSARATDYFVSVAGDDGAAGTSPTTAWRSLARVNSRSFQPGDRVLFKGGDTFRGSLRLGPGSAGTTNAPVVISSYGDGRPTISAGSETGVTIASAGNVTLRNLRIAGDGPATNTGYGVLGDNQRDGFQRLEGLRLEQLEVSGFGIFGILITGKQAGFEHVRVIGCDLHDNLRGGMEIAGRLPWDSPHYAHADVVVRQCQAHDNPGDPLYRKNHSGSGMVLYQVDGGLIEECRAWGNGRQCHTGNGGVGIWSCASRAVVIQYCESFANRTSGGDGGGFDLDGGSIDCVLQYNYSHDNDGPGLMAYTYAYASHEDRGNIIRFNVSDQDAVKAERYAGLWVRSDGSGMTGLLVHNNTVRAGHGRKQAVYVHGKGVQATFRNNLFVGMDEALPLIAEEPEDGLRFEDNLYWRGGAPFRICWADRTYGGLAAWQEATGQECHGGQPAGRFADPGFSEEPAGPAEKATWRAPLTRYQPRGGITTNLWTPLPASRSFKLARAVDLLGKRLDEAQWPFGAVAQK